MALPSGNEVDAPTLPSFAEVSGAVKKADVQQVWKRSLKEVDDNVFGSSAEDLGRFRLRLGRATVELVRLECHHLRGHYSGETGGFIQVSSIALTQTGNCLAVLALFAARRAPSVYLTIH